MQTSHLPELTETKIIQLEDSVTDPQMYIKVERFRVDPTVNATVYEIEVGIKNGDNVEIHKIITRFSILENLHQKIQTAYNGNDKLPIFPPKKYLWNTDKKFLIERQKDLQDYFTSLIKVNGISDVQAFKEFFEIEN